MQLHVRAMRCPIEESAGRRRTGGHDMGVPQLVSHQLCPYVQRAAIAFFEKGARFERVNVEDHRIFDAQQRNLAERRYGGEPRRLIGQIVKIDATALNR
jgi:glutaredoxin